VRSDVTIHRFCNLLVRMIHFICAIDISILCDVLEKVELFCKVSKGANIIDNYILRLNDEKNQDLP
jgi:hypothetical protein